jgi:hypothetical protein
MERLSALLKTHRNSLNTATPFPAVSSSPSMGRKPIGIPGQSPTIDAGRIRIGLSIESTILGRHWCTTKGILKRFVTARQKVCDPAPLASGIQYPFFASLPAHYFVGGAGPDTHRRHRKINRPTMRRAPCTRIYLGTPLAEAFALSAVSLCYERRRQSARVLRVEIERNDQVIFARRLLEPRQK